MSTMSAVGLHTFWQRRHIDTCKSPIFVHSDLRDLGSGDMAYHCVALIDLYLRIKFCWNRKTCGRILLRLAFIRSTQEELTGNFILGTFAKGRVVSWCEHSRGQFVHTLFLCGCRQSYVILDWQQIIFRFGDSKLVSRSEQNVVWSMTSTKQCSQPATSVNSSLVTT